MCVPVQTVDALRLVSCSQTPVLLQCNNYIVQQNSITCIELVQKSTLSDFGSFDFSTFCLHTFDFNAPFAIFKSYYFVNSIVRGKYLIHIYISNYVYTTIYIPSLI